MARLLSLSLDELPESLVSYVRQEAERDAEDVAALLLALGLKNPANAASARGLPAALLVGLGFAVRLFRWERLGFFSHQQHGDLTAFEFTRWVFNTCAQKPSKAVAEELLRRCRHIFDLGISEFAWEGQSILGADFLVHDVDEDLLISALAEFLWANRNQEVTHAQKTA